MRLGVRTYLGLVVTLVAVLSVGLTGLMVRRGVGEELAESGSSSDSDVMGSVVSAVMEAGLASTVVALGIALPIAFGLARPLRRLNDLASRMARGEPLGGPVAVGGGRELGELGTTLGRLASTLRRQDEVRRATAADVSHEIRGGLNGVIGRVEAIQDGVVDSSIGLRRVAEDARRLSHILDDLGLLVEAQRPGLLVKKQPVDVAAVVRERVAAHAQRFAAGSIGLDLKIGAATVEGDHERLGQVVENLLTNALRYTDPGGHVTVALSRTEHEAVIEVSDTGIGIPHEQITRVFDRFWRSPDARARTAQGSGVGLALVRDLVLAHHGRVEVASRVGEGSRFRVHLPVDPLVPADEPLRSSPAPAGSAAGPVVWSLHGDIDIANAASVQRELLKQIWTTNTDLMLDMSDVGFFGSSGLAILASADSEIRARGGRLIIVAAPPEVRRLLRLVGLPRSPLAPETPPAAMPAASAGAPAGAPATASTRIS
jgi:anti-anti-sigma factor